MSSEYAYSGLARHNAGQAPQGYGASDPAFKEPPTGFAAQPVKKSNKGLKIGIAAAVIVAVVVAAIVGGVLGSRAARDSNKNNNPVSNAASGGGQSGNGNSPSDENGGVGNGRFATATNTQFSVPIYPSATDTARFTEPTFSGEGWPQDSFQFDEPTVLAVRPDRPRLFAPAQKWEALPGFIQSDPYLEFWNSSLFATAEEWLALEPKAYFMDGGSGILDIAREVKQRIKVFGYAYQVTKEARWADRAYAELRNAATFGPEEDKWNAAHFLDAAELSAAFGIAYDWFHDIFDDGQKTQIRADLIQFGLQPGLEASEGGANGWWRTGTNGNWNCVCNGGLTIGSLAILGDDTTGIAEQLLALTVPNANENCVLGTSSDGTWAETNDYWYFGSTGHGEMASALMTAAGSDFGLMGTNPNFELTGAAHMHAFGPTGLFNYGDHGPNKFSATANSLMLYGDFFDHPEYVLFQREQVDAADPWSMFWYNPSVSGAFWNGRELDRFFDDESDQWAAMRSSWTDQNALYVAIKAGRSQDHQAHNDLDVGDFVLDAVGTRWAGELGSGDYLSPDYFSSDAQDAVRWLYYRKMTQGQNTLLIGQANQNVEAAPTVRHESSGTTQGSSTVLEIPEDSTVFWTTDMTSAYFDATSVKRGVRLLNRRRQVLLQDEINAQEDVQWRMHTNATITIGEGGTSATLERDGKTLRVAILSPPEGAQFSTSAAERSASDPTPPVPDQENPGITVLIISVPAGEHTLQVLFNPQWEGMSESDFVTPPTVALDDWSLTSHN